MTVLRVVSTMTGIFPVGLNLRNYGLRWSPAITLTTFRLYGMFMIAQKDMTVRVGWDNAYP